MKLNKKWVCAAVALVLLLVVLRMFRREGYEVYPEDEQRIEAYINSYQIDPASASVIKAETKEYIRQNFAKNGKAHRILQEYQVRVQRPRLIEGIEREFSYKLGTDPVFRRGIPPPVMGQPLMEAQNSTGPQIEKSRNPMGFASNYNGFECMLKPPNGFECRAK
jgi:hypothetical protein